MSKDDLCHEQSAQVDGSVSAKWPLQTSAERVAHEYFTVGNASSIAHPDDGLCIFAGDAPVRIDDNTTSFHLRAPIAIISDIIKDRDQIASVFAEVLNENADRFFPSAAEHKAGLKSEATPSAPQADQSHDTNKQLQEAREIIKVLAQANIYDDQLHEVLISAETLHRARSFLNRESGE